MKIKEKCDYCRREAKHFKSEVNVRKTGINGYLIEVKDQELEHRFAITKSELEKIVLYGQRILKDN